MNADPVTEFRSAMAAAGMPYNGPIVSDGTLQRFDCTGEKGKASWYVLHIDAHPAGQFGCHRRGIDGSWHAEHNGNLDAKSLNELRKQWRAEELKRNAEKLKSQAYAADKAKAILAACKPAPPDHPYLKRKQVPVLGDLKQNDGLNLVLPLKDSEGNLHSIQTIDADGDKLFLPGSRVQGVFYTLCDRPDGPLIIAEGYATAASCHLATGWATVAALNCGNLKAVTLSLKKKFPARTIILAADDDRFTQENPGVTKATEAANQFKPPLPVVVPSFSDQDTRSTDFNDLAILSGLPTVKACFDQTLDPIPCVLTPHAILEIPIDDNDRILGDHLLDAGQRLVIAAQGGAGKSRIAIQLLAAMRAGHKKFLNFDIHPGAQRLRWLYLQCENSARRLQDEFVRIRNWIDPSAWPAFKNDTLFYLPIQDEDFSITLDNPETLARLHKIIERVLPDGLLVDALYDTTTGDLNKDQDMRAALVSISRLAKFKNPRRPLITLHHALPGSAGGARAVGYERATFSRGSKVIHQWTRAQINIAPVSEDSSDQLIVSCGKCSDGPDFQTFAIRMNPSSMIYECDPTVDVHEVSESLKHSNRTPSICPPSAVRNLTPVCGASKPDLAKIIMDDIGCNRPNAYRYIKRALSQKAIQLSHDGSSLFRA